MDARGAPPGGGPPPVPWPAGPEEALALNHTGSFDWDLDRGVVHMDPSALALFGVAPEEFDGDPSILTARVPAAEAARLDLLVAQALKGGRSSYGAYFRMDAQHGTQRWTHTQGAILRTPDGRPYRIVGILRDATEELGQSSERLTLDAERSLHTDVVDATTAGLAHARTVREVLDALGSSRGLDQLGVISVVVGLVQDGRMQLYGEGELSGMLPMSRRRLDEPLPLPEAVRTLTPRYIASREEFARRYPPLWSWAKELGWSAAAFLPLIAQGEALGAIGLVYRDKYSFTSEERTLLTALTSSIAQSLERARLFEQEHELAEGLQRAMLPHSLPSIPGVHAEVRYRAAQQGRDIGGDWYDVIPLPGGRVAAVVGDVQGHDTDAAAVMGQLRIVLRAYAAEGHSAPTVMARASSFLHDLDSDRFATCLYVEADPATGWLRIVRAGHPLPLLRRSDGRCRPFPVMGALPLGLSTQFGQPKYPVTTMELEHGETLVLFTDGLVEQPGGDVEQGIEDLAEAVRTGPAEIAKLADRLCEVPEAWNGTDDLALVLLHREVSAPTRPARRLHQHVAPRDPESLATVRHMVHAAALSWGAGDRADDLSLVTDELVANALLHTGGGAVVTVHPLSGAQRRIRVEVTDRSSTVPQVMHPGASSISGRGLLLVDHLADVWGVEARGTGKAIWCEFVADGR
ncbi:SpoIIE family protein phosphatase [Streptomyces sp. DSM 42041]|uniref:SpoIIE family protein phosphatase n=1 Tax=Streptomyces hazeniae TaxID=3075538 RepID=A0ABU2NUS6_9ACTN|nr:SpoIIE family protein phosphatase [Streptomyces sp. DSM 42041]MDT0380376.1 SpoIIE family protein phosphatase [Streptomyces sp. DSM 42041]